MNPESEQKPVKVPKPKKQDVIAGAIIQLAEAIKGLEKKIDEKLTPVKMASIERPTVPAEAMPGPIVSADAPAISTGVPFPLEWRQAIDEVLSREFGSKVEYRPDGRFELSIYVPQKFSNAPKGHWDLYKEDLRRKIMDNHLGVQGVRDYAQLISENLGKDIMNKVNDSRSQLVGV